ncbi:glycosyltransferase family 4 protein [Desulfosoma sp.]|uniref:glycosyltransferase family 4 protein n=1 Tax=Desulfosoma sp. TaxID=2603217 RepID=UPI00404950B6
MHWATVDPFLLDDPFWQHKMGMPVANKQFLEALLQYGECSSYRFFVEDTAASERLFQYFQKYHADKPVDVQPAASLPFALQKRRADVFHNGDFTYSMPYLIEWRNGLEAGRRFPVTGVTHSLDTVSLYAKFIHLLLARPKPYDAIVCTSRCAVQMLEQAFQEIRTRFREHFSATLPEPPRLVHIPLGIPERIQPFPSRKAARETLGIPQDPVVVLSLGRLSPRAKMDLSPLLEGFFWLCRVLDQGGGPKVLLILAGAGRKDNVRLVWDIIQALGLGETVRVLPNVSEEVKDTLYAAADIFCSMVDNYQETFGLTLLEAMGAGLPIVASDFNGYRDLVLHGATGFLIPTYASSSPEPWEALAGLLSPSIVRFYRAQKVAFDVKEWIQALHTLICEGDLRRYFAEKARCRAQEFQWDRVIRAYRELWVDLVSHARQEARRTMDNVRSTVLTPSMNKIFSHYPSMALNDATLVGLGPMGAVFLTRGHPSLAYVELEPFLRQDVLHALARRVSQKDMTVEELKRWGVENTHIDSCVAVLHLDWLIKHGVLAPQKNAKALLRACR